MEIRTSWLTVGTLAVTGAVAAALAVPALGSSSEQPAPSGGKADVSLAPQPAGGAGDVVAAPSAGTDEQSTADVTRAATPSGDGQGPIQSADQAGIDEQPAPAP
jgi:hypothetical protein